MWSTKAFILLFTALGAVGSPVAEVYQRQAVSCPSGYTAKCCPLLVPTNALGTQLTVGVGCSPLSTTCSTYTSCCKTESFVVKFLTICEGSSTGGSGSAGNPGGSVG
ncbi:uncharacterized protein BP01DRAFT_361548 [Aspergillus saccharolyticus JOP 1030-1]|uniref:Hydrophobin n=1 Tax=Aspergillus saccharolyticus JOP 1030-1 TaxID=1450539 RepID=A0A318YZN5_9EURO|nr:hypothetical protein BP01DRAFT_361548 [Aspergillus saccharolyticus JOP 1030-1]PYH40079.1 hypothetical protein BP01DRAFT_361548 [Aspergillus saccharolyticus JOP 1030-1]